MFGWLLKSWTRREACGVYACKCWPMLHHDIVCGCLFCFVFRCYIFHWIVFSIQHANNESVSSLSGSTVNPHHTQHIDKTSGAYRITRHLLLISLSFGTRLTIFWLSVDFLVYVRTFVLFTFSTGGIASTSSPTRHSLTVVHWFPRTSTSQLYVANVVSVCGPTRARVFLFPSRISRWWLQLHIILSKRCEVGLAQCTNTQYKMSIDQNYSKNTSFEFKFILEMSI